jgi:hypothetical protein
MAAATVIPLSHVLIGLVVTILLGFGVSPVMDYAKKSMHLPPPSEATADQWSQLMKGRESGAVLGWLERFMFFAAFLAGADIAVAAWLAFKVASKWNAWENVITVPKALEGVSELDFLIARRAWGSHVLMTFLIGTAYNVVAGLLGAATARHIDQIKGALGF